MMSRDIIRFSRTVTPRYALGMRAALGWLLTGAFALGLAGEPVARADIYSWTDADGVVHFTNIPPRGAGKRKWKKVMDEAPATGSKAAARRGGCDRCDV